jgi:glutamate-1-semialdehyde 2,1-aminomutase
VYQAGTLSGNPLAVAAGLATLELLDAGAYQRLAATTDRLADGIAAAAANAGAPVQVPRLPGLFTVFFSDQPVGDYAGARAADAQRYAAFCRALLERGVYPPASQFEAWFPSLAHDDEHVERTLDAVSDAFSVL